MSIALNIEASPELNAPALQVVPRPATLSWAKFNSALKAALIVCSDDETLPNLNSLLIKSDGASLIIVSTDGHRLVKMTLRACLCDPFEFMLSRKDARQLALVVPPRRTKRDRGPEPEMSVNFYHGRAFFVSDACHYPYVPVTDRMFPPYEEVIPAPATAGDDGTRQIASAVGFAAEYLRDLGTIGKLVGLRNGASPIKIELAKHPLDPMRAEIVGDDIETIYVLMPIRL